MNVEQWVREHLTLNVTLIDHMGTDLTVANAARVSFGKQHDVLTDADTRLIQYLARSGHWTPFSHPQISLRITSPIFVARQLTRSTVGLTQSEVSRRYIKTEPECFIPDAWRERAKDVKQGSGECLPVQVQVQVDQIYFDSTRTLLAAYQCLLDYGVAPEQARMILPMSTLTEWIWTGSLAAFARVCRLRLDAHTQEETQEVARQIENIIELLFPVSWVALRVSDLD